MKTRVQAARAASPETLDLLARLEASQQSQWDVLTKAREDITALTGQVGVTQRDLLSLGAQIQALIGKIDEIRRPNYPLYGLLVGMFSLLVPGLGVFVTFYTTGSIAPVRAEITKLDGDLQATKTQLERQIAAGNTREQEIGKLTQTATANAASLTGLTTQMQRVSELALASAQADTTSRATEAQIGARVKTLEERLAEEQAARRSSEAADRVRFGEMETQFHAVSNIENLRWAWQNRLNSIVYNRTHPGENWPSDAFFPPSIFQGAGGSPPIPERN